MESENLSRVENILKNGGLSTPDIVIVVIYFLGKNAIYETRMQINILRRWVNPQPPSKLFWVNQTSVGIGLTV